MKKIIVAIDGYSSCGKSTIAKNLAKDVGYTYIDTGAMYRAVALYAIRKGLMDDETIKKDELENSIKNIKITFKYNKHTEASETYLDGENVENAIRQIDIAKGASRISELKFVREVLVMQQQDMGKNKGIVMDGRDIGTVVFPDAELKIFVTASKDIRAKRRFDELCLKGNNIITIEEVKNSIEERDIRDLNRKESPLKQAKDAIVLDNSEMTKEEQQKWIMDNFEIKTKE